MNDRSYTIDLTFSPFPLTQKYIDEYKADDATSSMIFLTVAMSFISSGLIGFIVKEQETKVKH